MKLGPVDSQDVKEVSRYCEKYGELYWSCGIITNKIENPEKEVKYASELNVTNGMV